MSNKNQERTFGKPKCSNTQGSYIINVVVATEHGTGSQGEEFLVTLVESLCTCRYMECSDGQNRGREQLGRFSYIGKAWMCLFQPYPQVVIKACMEADRVPLISP